LRWAQTTNKFLSKSIKIGTMVRYKHQCKKWEKYQSEELKELKITFYELSIENQTNMFISYLSYLYNEKRNRGRQIISQITSIRQVYLMEGRSVEFLTGPKIAQAIKSCRYSTKEIHIELEKKIYQQRLPFTLDMVIRARQLLWTNRGDRQAFDNKAVYLCIAFAYDTGRRISNFTHANTISEDHCLKTNQVHFVFEPEGITIPGGPSFRDYVQQNSHLWNQDTKIHWKQVSSILLYFFSQKEHAKFVITACKPLSLSRNTPGQSQLITDLCQWSISSLNDGEEEYLTRHVSLVPRKKRLIRAPVAKTIKNIASEFGLDPKRISTSSLRSAYATVSERVNNNSIETHQRAGWSKSSNVPKKHYIKSIQDQGALSYPDCGFDIKYLNQLNPRK
jgi:hypothetical protein